MGSFTHFDLVYEGYSDNLGQGLFARHPLESGTIVGLFDGIAKCIPVVDAVDKDRSLWLELAIHDQNLYYLDHEGEMRGVELINHSCVPNCIVTPNLLIITKCHIPQSQQLFFDYKQVTLLDLTFTCKCPKCVN